MFVCRYARINRLQPKEKTSPVKNYICLMVGVLCSDIILPEYLVGHPWTSNIVLSYDAFNFFNCSILGCAGMITLTT